MSGARRPTKSVPAREKMCVTFLGRRNSLWARFWSMPSHSWVLTDSVELCAYLEQGRRVL